jgi:hypothetical protein
LLRSISFSTIFLKAKTRNLNEIECFVKAVELKSLTAAAKALKLPKSKICALDGLNEIRLTALERMAGTTGLEPEASAVTGGIRYYNDLTDMRGLPNTAQVI